MYIVPDVCALSLKCDMRHVQIGVQVPKCFRVESAQQVRELNDSPDKLGNKKYLLKSIVYDPAHRADLFTLPSKAGPLER